MNNFIVHAPLAEVDIGLLADKVGVTPTNTLNLREGVHDFTLAVHVRVQQTQDVLELNVCFRDNERHFEE
jgi:hypothetical protein